MRARERVCVRAATAMADRASNVPTVRALPQLPAISASSEAGDSRHVGLPYPTTSAGLTLSARSRTLPASGWM